MEWWEDEISKKLNEFYHRHKGKSDVFSKDKMFSFSFKPNPYNLLREPYKTKIKKLKSDIIFGFRSGIIFTTQNVVILDGNNNCIWHTIGYGQLNDLSFKENPRVEGETYLWVGVHMRFQDRKVIESNQLWKYEEKLISEVQSLIAPIIEKRSLESSMELASLENERLTKLNNSKTEVLLRFDTDGDGTLDIIQSADDYKLLLKKHQSAIRDIEISSGANHLHQFVKIANFLNTKRSNLQLIFEKIKKVDSDKDLSRLVSLLEDEIHHYNLLIFNSLNLIIALIEQDLLIFYEIYERFDKLNIFNSNWENEVSNELKKVNLNLVELMTSMNDFANQALSHLEDLNFMTADTNSVLDKRLSEINSSITTSNLISLFTAYNTSKIKRNLNS